MLGLFGNLSPFELLVIAVVAVLVFGGRLPEVAGRTFAQLRRWRSMLEDLRRESGIDRELKDLHRTVRDVDYDLKRAADSTPASSAAPPATPIGETVPRSAAGAPPFRSDEEPGDDEHESPSEDAGTGDPAQKQQEAEPSPEKAAGSDGS